MDIAINKNEDLIISEGDFVIDYDTRSQHMYDILSQGKGNYKEVPNLCFNMRQLINSPSINQKGLESKIESELDRDGFENIEIDASNINDINVYGDFDGLKN